MKAKGIIFFIFLFLLVTGLKAQDSCADILDPCDGDPQQYECLSVTTSLTDNQGGEGSQVLQEYCFKEGSPLFQEMVIQADGGRLDLSSLQKGDEVGGIHLLIPFSDFGVDCPVGDSAIIKVPLIVTETHGDSVDLVLQFTEVNEAAVTCLFQYDPTDVEHNQGKILVGSLGSLENGGFELFLEPAELDEGASAPGLDPEDIDGSGSPVPLFFDVINLDNIFILPAAGGELKITTDLSCENESQVLVSAHFEDIVDIKPGTAEILFKRGDTNDDGSINLADAINLLSYLFGGDPIPACPDSGDSNDDGALDLADAISILSYLFSGGELSPPGKVCGPDVNTDELPVCVYTNC